MELRRTARLAGLVLVLGTLACTDDGYETTDLSGKLEVTPLFYGIDEGLPPVQFSASINNAPVTVTWETSNPAIATVSPTGLVTPLNDGFAAITATLSSNSAVKKSASFTVNALFGTPLVSGVAVSGINGTVGQTNLLYRVYVPAGTSNLTVTLTGFTGDFDIYVAPGPEVASFDHSDCNPWLGNNAAETCSFNGPQTGTWYIFIDPYSNANGAVLTATVTP